MATKNLEEAQKVVVAEIIRSGDQILIPEELTIDKAIELLKMRRDYEEQPTVVSTTFDAFPWDGAYALFNVLKKQYGWASMRAVYDWFGEHLPAMQEIEMGVKKVGNVPWGRLNLFQKDGFVDTSVEKKGNRYVFSAVATVKRKHEKAVQDLFAEVRVELIRNSIYRGKALSIRFKNDAGGALKIPTVKFVDTENCTTDKLVFSDDVFASIETSLFTPITRMADCKRCGIPVKRGILLAGDFGVGKTLAAKVAAALAVEHDETFIYCKRTDEFAEAIEFALQYGPAIVFCEDIDRVVTGERSDEMDALLNIIDGVDTKSAEVIIVLTTNAVDKINPAILRPGRLDAVIEVKRPDAKAVARLIKLYGQHFLDPEANLETASKMLENNIPAVIEEVVKRAKLAALRHTPPGSTDIMITEVDLRDSAATMKMQLDLLAGKKHDGSNGSTHSLDHAMTEMFDKFKKGIQLDLDSIKETVGAE
jgi:transitional endoplasmic reticulum ATPase